jgi:hypothetical protein
MVQKLSRWRLPDIRMTMGIEQESGISIFAAAGWVREIAAAHNTPKWAGSKPRRLS